ncbi:HAD-IB family hydrolase [Anaerosinus sp.]|uniref:HAD-IB family hydrolase n=1 Tax=Selenobaculum sp. TaxID=3074374 RepID=UPI003AB798ED
MKERIALFDFCDTLVSGQTVSMFFSYLQEQESLKNKIKFKLKRKFSKMCKKELTDKERFLFVYEGYEKAYFLKKGKEFFQKIILSSLKDNVLKVLQEHQQRGHRIIIVSGGLDIYLNYFCEYFKIDDLICTKLKFKDDSFSGYLEKPECLGREKVNQLMLRLSLDNIDLVNSYAYSDHISDLPIVNFVGNGYWVKMNGDIVKDESISKFNLFNV